MTLPNAAGTASPNAMVTVRPVGYRIVGRTDRRVALPGDTSGIRNQNALRCEPRARTLDRSAPLASDGDERLERGRSRQR